LKIKKPVLSIVIPTYNERKNIFNLVHRLERIIKKEKILTEIIIVDDDSPDRTAEAAMELNKKYDNVVTIIRKSNKGFSKSLFHGLKSARGRYILCMDADLVHDPKEIPKMIKLMTTYDVVIGSRYLSESKIKRPMYRNFVSLVGQHIQRVFLGISIKDTTNNFRMFKRRVFLDIKHNLHTDGNVFLLEFLYYAAKKYKIIEIPIKYLERTEGESKMSAGREAFYFIKRLISLKLAR